MEQREIEAAAIAPLYRAFAGEVGEERARAILADTVGELARQAGCSAAAAVGGNSLEHLKQAVERWKAGGALELTVVRHDADALEFNVTRCRFAEMYRRLGLADLGPILSCSRDARMVEGFNPGLGFTRTRTLMEGAEHCDFRFSARKSAE
ncbi:MAG: L-2-amino-thiazoline-4-carboxylic acid hydrolase [Gemmataceae bacterium]